MLNQQTGLFAPYELAGMRIKSRLFFPSMVTRMSAKAAPTQRLTDHYLARARGGAALIVSEPLSMARHQKIAHFIRVWNDDNVDALKRLTDTLGTEDTRILGSIQDSGRNRHAPGRNLDNPIGPSAMPDDLSWTMPAEMSVAFIERMIEDVARSALRLKTCGFSGVEISACHGHLYHQFLSPWSNLREDRYGGDFSGRMRILDELVDALRASCGADFIVGIKLAGDDGIDGSIRPDLSLRMAEHIARRGQTSYIALGQGTHHRTLEMHVPDGHRPPLVYMDLYRDLRRQVPDMPLVALGRITGPDEASGILARGEAEMIGLGRAFLADPQWGSKARDDRSGEIRYCVSANRCWESHTVNHLLACENNPRLAAGTELAAPRRAEIAKRVVVVGAGIAGLEAALTAAGQGHAVSLLGRSAEAGGKARLAAKLPGNQGTGNIYAYQFAAVRRAGVTIELDREAVAADIAARRPDVVVLATGATMTWPRCIPTDLAGRGVVDLRVAVRMSLADAPRRAGTAVVFDMDHTDGTYAAAELFDARFARVVVVTPRESIAQDTSLVARQGALRRLSQKGIEMVTLSEPRFPAGFSGTGRIEIEQVLSGMRTPIEDVTLFAYSTPRRPNIELVEPLKAAGIDVRLAGDCRIARNSLAATAEGYAVGVAIV